MPTLQNVRLDYPPSYFNGITNKICSWKLDVNIMLLSWLASECDDKLMPTVLCPWEWSEYIHKCRYVPLDLIIQRHLHDCYLRMCNTHDKYRKVYPRRESDFNLSWSPNPSGHTIRPQFKIRRVSSLFKVKFLSTS